MHQSIQYASAYDAHLLALYKKKMIKTKEKNYV